MVKAKSSPQELAYEVLERESAAISSCDAANLPEKIPLFVKKTTEALKILEDDQDANPIDNRAVRGEIYGFTSMIYEKIMDFEKATHFGRAAISEMQICFLILKKKEVFYSLLKNLMSQLSRNLSAAATRDEGEVSSEIREENTLILGSMENYLIKAQTSFPDIFEEFSQFWEYIIETKKQLKMDKMPYFEPNEHFSLWPFDVSDLPIPLSLDDYEYAQIIELEELDIETKGQLETIFEEFQLLEDTFLEAFEEGSKVETQINALKALIKKIPKASMETYSGISLKGEIEFSVGKYYFGMENHKKALATFRNCATNAFHAFHILPCESAVLFCFEIMIAIFGSAMETDNYDEAKLAGGTALSVLELLKQNYKSDDLEDEIIVGDSLMVSMSDLGEDCQVWYPKKAEKWPYDETDTIDANLLSVRTAPLPPESYRRNVLSD